MGKGVDVGQTLVTSDRSQAAIVQLCQQSPIGKCLPNAFYIHHSALPHLDEGLFCQEQAARSLVDAKLPFTLIKFHFDQPKLSYLYYPDFDQEPHPLLRTSTVVDWQASTVATRDYDPENPPLLHQKDQLITEGYPGYSKFAKLSQQERKWGLLDDPKAIFDRRGWEQCLAKHGAELRGHRVVWRKDATEYQKRVRTLHSQLEH